MRHIGLFEGIGGFSLAARWMGWDTIAWCEWNEFCQKVLSYHFPKAKKHGDITKTDFTIYRGQCDILTGGFPCQPYSTAGKRLGKEDNRHLWPEMLRAIREIQPRWIVGENVRGLVNWNGGMVFDEVQTDLENEGYEVTPFLLPACAVNAPHRRDRIWFVAYSHRSPNRAPRKSRSFESDRSENNDEQSSRRKQTEQHTGLNDVLRVTTNTYSNGQQWSNGQHEVNTSERGFNALGNIIKSLNNGITSNAISSGRIQNNEQQSSGKLKYVSTSWQRFPTVSPLCNGNDGISKRLDGITFPKWRSESIKAGGNAIVPQVAHQIFKAIEQYENI